MALLLTTFITIILITILATYVASRAWKFRTARYFVAFSICLGLINLSAPFRGPNALPQVAYAATALTTIFLAALMLTLLWLLSALFMPQWWDGSRPIRWISLPYVLVVTVLALDTIVGFGWIFNGLRFNPARNQHQFISVAPGAKIMLVGFVIGTLVLIAMLVTSWLTNRETRGAIGLLLVVMAGAMGFGFLNLRFTTPLLRFDSTLLLLAALGYLVVRQRLFEPQDQAIALGMENMSDGLAVLNRLNRVLLSNHQARQLGLKPGGDLMDELTRMGVSVEDQEHLLRHQRELQEESLQIAVALGQPTRLLELTQTVIRDRHGTPHGTLLLFRDVTELERRTALLDREQKRLAEMVERLEQERQQRTALAATVRALSLPAIPVLDGVLVLPLIGTLDDQRLDDFTDVLLDQIETTRARQALIDFTGVELVDDRHMLTIVKAVRGAELLGARCTLVGIRPELAQSLAAHIDPLDTVQVAATLQEALRPIIRQS